MLKKESQENLNQLFARGHLQVMVKQYENLLDVGHQFQLAHPGSRPDNETLQTFLDEKRIGIRAYETFIHLLTDFVNEKIDEIKEQGQVLEPSIPKYMKSSTVVATHERKFGQDAGDDVILEAERLGVSSRNPEDLSKNLIKKSQTMKEVKRFGNSKKGKGSQKEEEGVQDQTDYTKWIILAGIVVAAGVFIAKKK